MFQNAIPYVFSSDHLGSLMMDCNDNVRRFDSDKTLSLLQVDKTQQLLKRGGEYMSCFSWWHVIKVCFMFLILKQEETVYSTYYDIVKIGQGCHQT